MHLIQINTVSDQLTLFMLQFSYNELMIAKELDISPQTVSSRLYTNQWLFDEIRAIRRLFKRYNLDLFVNVKQKVKINWRNLN